MTEKISKELKERNKIVREFKQFLEKDILLAIDELKGIANAKNRTHIQKLVYSNLVDRFDHILDKILILSYDNNNLKEGFFKTKEGKSIDEKQLYELLLLPKDKMLQKVQLDFQLYIRLNISNKRHSLKLEKVLESLGMEKNKYKKNRVNESTGKIFSERKKHKTIPIAIVGYSDWLYCRRNAIVHGGRSSKISDSDLNYINNNYKVQCTGRVKITLGSITTAKNFYSDLIHEIELLLKDSQV